MFNRNDLAGIKKSNLMFKEGVIKNKTSGEIEEYVIRFSDGSIVFCDGLKDQNDMINQLVRARIFAHPFGWEDESKNKNQGTQRSPFGMGA